MPNMPTTISEAFAAWSGLGEQTLCESEEAKIRLADERAKIEDAAVLMPVTSARDAWQLLAMTVDEANQPNTAAETLFERARAEASAGAMTVQGLASIFARWLPLATRVNEGTATDAEAAEDAALCRLAAQSPAADALDVWRKVAIAFDVTDPYHIGTAAVLMAEARTVLGVVLPTRH